MELIIEYFIPLTFDQGLIVCVPTTVTLEVEADDLTGNTDYWISAVYIEGTKMSKGVLADRQDDHRIPDSDPMSEAIRTYAYRTHKRQLDELWQSYLNDLSPRRRHLSSLR